MVKNEKIELLNKWKLLAQDDLKVAQLAFENRIYLRASFHCQQAIEKVITGSIIFFKE
jgi:HEPN domain-containing protein